jgi:hypothetical protein
MISAEALRKFFQRSPKNTLRMTRETLFAPSLWEDGLPTADADTFNTIAATPDGGIVFCVEDGVGGYEWVSVTDLRSP